MSDVVIVEAVRSPLGRRNGGLSTCHSVDVLGSVQAELFNRSGVDPAEVGQVIGGCVGQVGMQTMNVARNAWLAAGLPLEVAATTVDTQCGSSQQATNLARKGEGTVGLLLNSPDLYLSLTDALETLDQLIVEVQILVKKMKTEGVKIDL